MAWESSDVVRFDLGLLLQGQTGIATLKSAYISLTGPGVLGCEINDWEIMGWESFDVFRFGLWPFLQGQTRVAKLKVLVTCLLLVLQFWDVKLTCSKSWVGRLLMWTDLTLGPSSLFTSLHWSFSISYKIASCRDALFLCTKTFSSYT